MDKKTITLVEGSDSYVGSALGIIDALPRHFLPSVKAQIAPLFTTHPSLVAIDDSGNALGFLIWEVRPDETELLWMAVHPASQRQSVGSSLVRECLRRIDLNKAVILLTATTDSVIPGTEFDGAAYGRTLIFFESHGFVHGEVRLAFWGKQNHCLVMRYSTKRSEDQNPPSNFEE